MAHLIMEHDLGFVNGETWHKLQQYTQLSDFPTLEQAQQVASYPLDLREAHVLINGEYVATGGRAIIRTDHNVVLHPHVGPDFVLEQNDFLLKHIEENFLRSFPDIKIESVGTIRNGATFFLNLKVDEFQINGDKSPQVSRMMFFNPLGLGSYKSGVHNTRIVCNNTLNIAEAQSRANGSLFKVRHTQRSVETITDALQQMALFRLGLEEHKEKLNHLAQKMIDTKVVAAFIQKMYRLDIDSTSLSPEEAIEAAKSNKKSAAVLEVFESDQSLKGGTAYALLNAYTNAIDHRKVSKSSDDGQVLWDNLYGNPAQQKEAAMNFLMAV